MTLTEILLKGVDVSAELNELKDLFENGKITPKGYIKGLNRLMNRSEQYTHFLNEVEHYLNTLPSDTVMNSHQMVKAVLARKPSGKTMHNNATRLNIKPSDELKASV